MSERIEQLLEQQNALLMQLIETIEQHGSIGKQQRGPGWGKGFKEHLTQEERDALNDEVDIDWWFSNYGEEALPAKYMHAFSATGGDVDSLYEKEEGDYIFSRMKDYVDETNEQGTHVFTYLGKKWCKREGNARNCFAFMPVKKKIGVTDDSQ